MIDFSKYPLPRRWRHHVAPNMYFPYNDNIPNKETYPPLIDKINWQEHFHNGKAPNSLDIGSAWGKFTIQYSEEHKDENVLGIEIRQQTIDYAIDVKEKETIGNVSFLWYSIVNGLDFLENESIDKAFYFFPDPWFKEKHKKRRAFDMNFLENIYKVLKKDGVLYLQTDIKEVHEDQIELINKFGKYSIETPGENDWKLPRTNKEEECIRSGYEYWRTICRKIIY